ncbi:MAG: ABC transporter permease [Clostridia bacterium]|nr:ABC transporter permease [Clostridia bacterium]
MKLLSSYIKEMKIAARGYYFYIEIFFAILLLIILLVAVKENPISKETEFLFYDMPAEMVDAYYSASIAKGDVKAVDDTILEAKAVSFDVTDENTKEVTSYAFGDESYQFKTFEMINTKTGQLTETVYIADSEEAMIHMSYLEKKIGATMSLDANGGILYKYFTQGFETTRLKNLLYILHNESGAALKMTMDNQSVRKLGTIETLNARENMVPVFIVFMGSLMGFFIVMAYIFLDKSEGVIRAFAVTPSSVWKYLLSKTLVIMTTVAISSSVITIPVMGIQPNYLLFYLLLLISTFSFASLGLLIASFFDSISKAFGALYTIMIILMLPAFSYFLPSFDPLWLRFFPTYPLLQSFKEIIMVNTDVGYVLANSGIFLAGGLIVFLLANLRFKKTLTV